MIICIVILVLIVILLAFICIRQNNALAKSKSEILMQKKRIQGFADIYNSMHILNLEQDTVEEFKQLDGFPEFKGIHSNAIELMKQVILKSTAPEYLKKALAFTDLTTLRDRLKDCDTLSSEFFGNSRWWRGRFIVIDRDSTGLPVNVIWATVIVQDEKKREEGLIHSLHHDVLTQLYNRKAFEDEIADTKKFETTDMCVVSLDLNGLKRINDSFGHIFGDEMLQGASQCMSTILGPYGKIYRVGGDEFAAILDIPKDQVEQLFTDFGKELENWKGKMLTGISMSYGYIYQSENPSQTISELLAIADERMYLMKKQYYSQPGVDRRKQ